MILSAQSILQRRPLSPLHPRTRHRGLTYGLGPAGYDVRVAESFVLLPLVRSHVLASTVEHFSMPTDLVGRVCDKSTWARRWLFVQNTVIEPGWRGHLTLEITYDGWLPLRVLAGTPIAQVLFELVDRHTELPYEGKYQDQEAGAQRARFDRGEKA